MVQSQLAVYEKDRSDPNYHMQFVSNDVMSARAYGRQIDTFLSKVFARDAPLEYLNHTTAQSQGKQVILVRFQLSDEGDQEGYTFDTAANELCKNILKQSSKRHLNLVTDRSILGISPVSQEFRYFWNRAFFREALNAGPPLLNTIQREFRDNYLPSWATVLAFSVVSGLNFSIFTEGTIAEHAIVELLTAGGAIATTILRRYATKKPSRPLVEQQRYWNETYSEFKDGLTEVVEAMGLVRAAGLGAPSQNPNGETPEQTLCEALYQATISAAEANTANQEIFEAYLYHRQQEEKNMVKGAAATALSLWAGYSAFWTVTTTTAAIAPLGMWGVMDVVGLVLFLETPMLVTTTTTFWWCPPAAFVAGVGVVGYSIFTYKKNQERKKFDKKVAYHQKMKEMIAYAWGLAYDTRVLLEWVYCTDARYPERVDFVNEEARQKWNIFISKVKALTPGGTASPNELSPRFVLTYLDVQRESLTKMQQKLGDLDS